MVGAAGFGCSGAVDASLAGIISGLTDIGFDNGEGVVSLLFASDDPRAGMLTTFASFLAIGVASCALELANSNFFD